MAEHKNGAKETIRNDGTELLEGLPAKATDGTANATAVLPLSISPGTAKLDLIDHKKNKNGKASPALAPIPQ